MGKRSFLLILFIFLQFACGLFTSQPETPPGPSTEPDALAESTNDPSLATEAVSSTEQVEPELVTPPYIDPESFGKAEVLHEYWPVIREAANIPEAIDFGTSISAWAYSADGRYVAVAGCDGEVRSGYVYETPYVSCAYTIHSTVSHAYFFILDAKTESIIATLPETGEVITVTHMQFTHDGNHLIYYLDSGRIVIWDFEPASIFAEIPILGIPQFSTDGKRALFEDYPYLVIYDTTTWQELSRRILVPDGIDNTYTYSPDLSRMATCDTRLTEKPHPMKIWDTDSGELIQQLDYRLSRCARLVFSPDSNFLLRFDDHGAGPAIWNLDGGKFVNGSDVQTDFVGAEDLYVNSMQFSRDGRTVMVDTEKRLTLYDLPVLGDANAPSIPLTTSSPTTRPNVPAQEIKIPSCEIVVHGYFELHLQGCDRSNAGKMSGTSQRISLLSIDPLNAWQVDINLPNYMHTKLAPGTYIISDATGITAFFSYQGPEVNIDPVFRNYDGTLTLTQAGLDEDYISGSYKFGAHNYDGYQINVEGTFENVPFSHVNAP